MFSKLLFYSYNIIKQIFHVNKLLELLNYKLIVSIWFCEISPS